MFERKLPKPFPVRNILLLALAVLLILIYMGKQTKPNQIPKNPNANRPSEEFFSVREYPHFTPDIDVLARALTTNAERNYFEGFDHPWTIEGPGNLGARINTIKVHPSNPNIIYIGYSAGGIWKTTDGGINWFPIFDDQPFLAIGDIELDPNDPNIVYAGTGDPNIGGYPFIGDGIWKSTNGGNSWQHIGLREQRIISKIIVHPSNPNTLFVATMGLPFQKNNYRGVYKTTNNGNTWDQILFVSDQTGAIDLEINPANPDVLYAAMWDRIRNNQQSIVSGENARIWKTQNGGASWSILEQGLPNATKSRIGLDLDLKNPAHLVAIYADEDLTFDAIYETYNAGLTWNLTSSIGLDPNFQSNFAWYFGKIFINPFQSNQRFACGISLWKSTDNGENWSQATPPWWTYEVHADKHDIAFIDAHSFLLATDGGLYRTYDAGESFEKIENIPTSQIYRVAHNPHQPTHYYGGLQDNGTTGGNHSFINDWPRLYGGDGFQAAFHPQNEQIYYMETQNGGISGTIDGGNSFNDATNGLDNTDRRAWDMPYFISKNSPDKLYTGTFRVYEGSGHLPEWKPISEDLTDGNIFGARFHTISCLDESLLNPSLLVVGTSDANVWRGNPNTASWINITGDLPNHFISSIKTSPWFPNTIYVTQTGYRNNDFSPKIYKSTNLGDTWVALAGNLPPLAINDLLILPNSQDSVLFVATDGGVFGTMNAGISWQKLGNNMPSIAVFDLELNPKINTLIAGTFARSIWSFDLNLLAPTTLTNPVPPTTPQTLLVHPNPVALSESITIEVLNPETDATLVIYQSDSRKIWNTSLRAPFRAQLTVPTHTWKPGVYFLSLQKAGKMLETVKIVVASP